MSAKSTILIRYAMPHEAAEIREVVRAAYAKWIPIIGREPLPMKADYDKNLREHRFDVAYADHRILGLIETALQPDHIWIENVAVHPEQGRGIGRALLHHVEQIALKTQLTEARSLTNKAFRENVILYEKFDYRVDREEVFLNGTTVYMSKRLLNIAATEGR